MLDAAAAILCTEGAAAVSVQRVADSAGTSKALVHYHFAGKDALLVACVVQLASQLVQAETTALAASTPVTALNDLWTAVMEPRVLGLRRALLALITDATPATRSALVSASHSRRQGARRVVDQLRALLSFPHTVAISTLAVAHLALIDGLTLDSSVEAGPHHRHAFDAFWLAILSLEH
jgi:AcrR family transcriptional regulator